MGTLTFHPGAAGIVVPTRLTGPIGSRRIDMALDTGATFCVVPPEIAKDIGHDPELARERVRIATASDAIVLPVVDIRQVTAVECTAAGVRASCHDLPPESGVDGLLGLSFLKRFRLSVDFEMGVLSLE